ncbi:MAG: secretin N-terminal domain-containing protein [Candidatus Omnitrophota bacterium]|nr:secretin N-terminal domain-containing protein [Candidatus Omnitrophota bacterium]
MKTYFRAFVFIFVLANLTLIPKLSASEYSPISEDNETSISMDLQDASLKDVLKILSIQSGLNFVASEAVQDRKLTLYMDKVPLKEAMDKIFKANNLSYDLDKEANIFIVNDWGKPTTQTVTKVFYLKHATVSSSSLKEEMKNNISATSSSDSSSESSSSSSGSSSSSSSEGGKWKAEEEAGITSAVKKLLSKDGSVIEDFRTNSLIVTDIPSRMEVVSQVITSLDISVPQVLLEVEMLDVSKNVVDQIGFKFGQTPFSVALSGAAISTEYPFSPAMYAFRSVAKTLTAGSINVSNGTNGTSVYNMQLDFLRTQTDTKFLARPKILTLNNETAEVKITTDEAVGVTSVQQGQGDASSTTGSAERFATGVTLRVTPQIDLEAGEITMFVYPQVAEASTTTVTFTSNGEDFTFHNPEIRSTKTTVCVKDGETVVLGGLIRNQKSTIITKLPILGDIPILGALFRHKNQSPDNQRELLVFITPHIVKSAKADTTPLKKTVLPLREQAQAIPLSRQQSMSTYLNNFEAKR